MLALVAVATPGLCKRLGRSPSAHLPKTIFNAVPRTSLGPGITADRLRSQLGAVSREARRRFSGTTDVWIGTSFDLPPSHLTLSPLWWGPLTSGPDRVPGTR
jgi:hypothetical protein